MARVLPENHLDRNSLNTFHYFAPSRQVTIQLLRATIALITCLLVAGVLVELNHHSSLILWGMTFQTGSTISSGASSISSATFQALPLLLSHLVSRLPYPSQLEVATSRTSRDGNKPDICRPGGRLLTGQDLPVWARCCHFLLGPKKSEKQSGVILEEERMAGRS
ncbi:unnamed protein product [Protopolystoma xenopodis]|uniref:Uncharacterized protein n=1 Tax=Protopolystoma xenopodis TaxID=117903 RepID=A0A448WF39_9PLAT|nr:unnamed protein product [Protopolystoma xenopodis]